MNELVQRLPEELENEVKEFTFTDSLRLELLLEKYPLDKMDTFLKRFSKKQLDKIYREGCISKVFNVLVIELSFLDANINYMKPKVKELFEQVYSEGESYYHPSIIRFAIDACPERLWLYNNPSNKKYINSITNFCRVILLLAKEHKFHTKIVCFCEKVIYDLIVGLLIMRNKFN
jgi:hypothetical protein